MTLRDYLTDAMATDYREGHWDCAIFVARWVDLRTGSRIEKQLAGSYENKLSGLRKYGDARGPARVSRLAENFLRECGWEPGGAPETGDVVTLDNGDIAIAWNDGAVKLLPGRVVGLCPPDQIRNVWKWKGGSE